MNTPRQIGISIYPAHQSVEEMKNYLNKASKLKYTRLFASMLELDKNTKDSLLKKFKDIFKYARKLNFDVCLDVNPRIFDLIGVSPSDLSIFNELNVTTVRLDMAMDGKTEAQMTYNKYDINIEVNISNGTEYIKNIVSYKPKTDKLIASHNFYPQKNTGIEYNFFIKATKLAKKHGIRTSAFISSAYGKQGPWSTLDGLPTLEIHRNMPITTQAKHLWATGLIDDILIGNAFASDKELESLVEIDKYRVTLSVILEKETSDIEKRIILLDSHYRRGDINEFIIRSTMSRVWYKQENFAVHDNDQKQIKGNIYIGNNDFGIYKGELQLVINNMDNDLRKNLVAKVAKEDLFLIDYIESWSKFKLIIEEHDD